MDFTKHFEIGKLYSKSDIYRLLEVPLERRRGEWDKGYRFYNGAYFIFANVGIEARTGHNYSNYWVGKVLHWEGRTRSHKAQPQIKELLLEKYPILIFTRNENRSSFKYEGLGKPISYNDVTPIRIAWSFEHTSDYAGEIPFQEGKGLYEGLLRTVQVNKFERSRKARLECIEAKGYLCTVCGFDFERFYGIAGTRFIHVHHLVELSSIREAYIVDPLQDLTPVCANCHVMLHRRIPAYTIEELRAMIVKATKS